MMNAALFIASEKGYTCLKNAVENGYGERIKLAVSFKEVNVDKSYDEDIKELCVKNGIKFFLWQEIKNQISSVFTENNIEIAFAISWKFLIDISINDIMKYPLIVLHDSLLPRYRGFAPTPTAVMCGETEHGISALYAVEGVDEGDIVLQKKFSIGKDEYIAEILHKESQICADMIVELIDMAEKNSIIAVPQNNTLATYSIWRDVEDCRIDWNMSSEEIYNLIRAVSSPYPGAFFYYDDRKVIVERAEISEDMSFPLRNPGKIWAIKDNVPYVICGKGIIKIISAVYEDGTQVKFTKLRVNLQRR